MTTKRLATTVVMLSTAALFTGCGSGAGASGDGTSGTPSSSTTVMRQVFDTAWNAFQIGGKAMLPEKKDGATANTFKADCPSGSGTATWNDADSSNTINTGDTVSFSYVKCQKASILLNGNLDYTAFRSEVDTNATTMDIGYDLTYENWSRTDVLNNISITVNGNSFTEATVKKATTDTSQIHSFKGDTLTLTRQGRNSGTLTRFSLQSSSSDSAFSFDLKGTLTSPGWSAPLTVSVPIPISGVPLANPSAGEIRGEASNGSVTGLTMSATGVTIDVDSAGNGVFGSRVSYSWTEFLSR
jgi:hypothetical protein